MDVSGIGATQRSELPEDDGAVKSAAPQAADSTQAAAATRGTGQAVPANVSSAVLGYDEQHHPGRNIPDARYGPVLVGGEKQADGSWLVTVGSMRTSIAGPLPGMDKKPFDLNTYLFKNGKIHEVKPVQHGAGDAAKVEKALDKGDNEGAITAADDAIRNVMLPSFGFPRIKDPVAPADADRVKGMLSGLEKDGKLDDFKAAVDAQQKASLDRFGGRPPMDWFGPKQTFSAVVDKFGTPSQKAIWNAAAPTQGGAASADAAKIEKDMASGDTKAATQAALASAEGLYGPGLGFPRMTQNPDPAKVQRFKDMLSGIEKDGKINALRDAVAAENEREFKAIGGRPGQMIPDWFGASMIMSNLISTYGSASQKDKWGVGHFGVFNG
jgi:hypothetical protein